jgi:hypothetical protein
MKYNPFDKHIRPELALTLRKIYRNDPIRFVEEVCQIKVGERWSKIKLWKEQKETLLALINKQKVIVLKARQLGMTWLSCLAGLYFLLFNPGSVGLIVSLRETEAKEVLEKLIGIYKRLPSFLQSKSIEVESATQFKISNGSEVHALPSHRGDSYTAKWVLIDECSLIPNLNNLLGSIEPTINDSGHIWLVSRPNKSEPEGTFAKIAKASLIDKTSDYHGVFLPWYVRPERDQAWYEAQVKASLEKTGTLDLVEEQYPESVTEALQAPQMGKRIPGLFLSQTFLESKPQPFMGIVGLDIFYHPEGGKTYCLGADPAQGILGGDESAIVIVELETGLEVCSGGGPWEPTLQFPNIIEQIARYYNNADILIERNNHGHGVIGQLKGKNLNLKYGPDGSLGFNTSQVSKSQAYDLVAAEFQLRSETRSHDPEAPPLVSSPKTYMQLASIDADTLSAPSGSHDDRAMAYVLAQYCRIKKKKANDNTFKMKIPNKK